MRRYTGERNWVKAKFPKARCLHVGEQLRRYGVRLKPEGEVVAYGQSPNQAWRRAYEKCLREGWL